MAKKILLAVGIVAVLIGVFCGYIAMQPADFQVTRSGTIPAPPGQVFPHINDLHKWEAWSPWAKRDPAAKNTFEGPEAGKGAIFRWAGNSDVGEGSMTITESKPNELVRMHLHFLKPFEDEADVEFTLKPEGEQTAVTWNMHGQNNFIAKAMCLFMDMDKMVGGDFELGLSNLKEVVEAEKKKPADG